MTSNHPVETIPTKNDDRNEAPDVVSDPAKDDTQGQDWSDEGGATSTGPATDSSAE